MNKEIKLLAVYNLNTNIYTTYLHRFLKSIKQISIIKKFRKRTIAFDPHGKPGIEIDPNPGVIFYDPESNEYRVWLDIRDDELARSILRDYIISKLTNDIELLHYNMRIISPKYSFYKISLDKKKTDLMMVKTFFDDELIG